MYEPRLDFSSKTPKQTKSRAKIWCGPGTQCLIDYRRSNAERSTPDSCKYRLELLCTNQRKYIRREKAIKPKNKSSHSLTFVYRKTQELFQCILLYLKGTTIDYHFHGFGCGKNDNFHAFG
uniref:Uncharacterized protein n=1 Tax=Romanomermis culicivorax TaxID=13658 RepID=A0A915IVV4_ROMCU